MSQVQDSLLFIHRMSVVFIRRMSILIYIYKNLTEGCYARGSEQGTHRAAIIFSSW